MYVSTNELRVRAAAFSSKWADAHYEKGETQSFYNEFFGIFDVERRRVARYEEHVKKLDGRTGFIDLYWPKVLLVEQKSAGRDLARAHAQADEYFDALTNDDKPRFQLACDFRSFDLYDRDTADRTSFPLAELPRHIEAFDFIRGREKRVFRDQDPVNIKAAEIMGGLHDALEGSGYRGHQLERFLVRLVFMLFADDTGIFEPRDHLLDVLESRTNPDGSDTGLWLHKIFEVLDTPEDQRSTQIDTDLNRFPYVNGGLFGEHLRLADFNSAMREKLLVAARFNWASVSPAIFGSLFQSVMDGAERRKKGAHYTSEKNILKLIGPLFLDDLRSDFERIKGLKRGRMGELEAFRRRLGVLTFLDPACGCGNFLIIAYRELRLLEMDVLREIRKDGQLEMDVRLLSLVDVDQFYGIEKEEFPVRIAEAAMWMIDHIMNNRMSLEFGQNYVRIPLKKSPHIHHADALETDWNAVLPAHQCSYVLGNPPFIGQSYQSPDQRLQMARIIDQKSGKAGSLDYVGAWFLKAGVYVQDSRTKIAFVSTNSITQGEQVAQLWPLLFDRYHLEISFAHRTFAWGSEARGQAHVHVVIIGLTRADMEPPLKRLFSYEDIKGEPVESQHKALTAYLVDAGSLGNRHVLVREENITQERALVARMGSKPVDGGNFILDADERARLIAKYPNCARYIPKFIGSQELINSQDRWILSLQTSSPNEIQGWPDILDRVRKVREFRLKSSKLATFKLASYPLQYEVNVLPLVPYLAIPETSSENRTYIPIGFINPPTVPSNALRIIENAQLHHFAILTSAMHMAWMRTCAGRLKSDYRYSIGLVYNTFPWPEIDAAKEARLSALAGMVLEARSAWPDATLADLYDPDLMPPNLRKAHQALDLAVDRLYKKEGFASERERVEHLFALYEKLISPVEAAAKTRAPKSAKRKPSKTKLPDTE